MLGAIRVVLRKPIAKNDLELMRQAQQYISGAGRARLFRCGHDVFHLMIGDGRNHRRHQYARGNAGLAQLLDHA